MSQLRKLRRHVRSTVALDLETMPLDERLSAGAFAAESGMPADWIAEALRLRPEQAQALVEEWQKSYVGDARP